MKEKLSLRDELLRDEFKKTGGNIAKVARHLGLTYDYVLSQQFAPALSRFAVAVGPPPDDIRTLGKPGMQQFVIACKRAGCGWPAEYDEAIARARRLFDSGTHEMFQSNRDGWVVQYLVPREVPTKKRNFFGGMQNV